MDRCLACEAVGEAKDIVGNVRERPERGNVDPRTRSRYSLGLPHIAALLTIGLAPVAP
jgi:hypothetical protein